MTTTLRPSGALPALAEDARQLLFTDARTTNTYASTPVSDSELAEIWELAKWAPTAANTQPLRVLYVRTQEGKDRLLTHVNEGNQAKVRQAPAVAVLAIDTKFHEHIPAIFPMRPEMRDAFASNPQMSEDTSRFSGALQAGYFVLAVRAVGLAAGPMAGFDRDGVDAEFFADGRLRSILLVGIGHPGENPWFDRLPRLGHADVIQWA